MIRYFHGDARVVWVMGQTRVRDTLGFGHAMDQHAIACLGFDKRRQGPRRRRNRAGRDNLTLPGTAGAIRMHQEREVIFDDADARTAEVSTDQVDGWEARRIDVTPIAARPSTGKSCPPSGNRRGADGGCA